MTKLNIAICDDNERELGEEYRLIEEVLAEKNIESSIECYDTSKEFIENYSKKGYDIVFLDIMMDNMNGLEAAERVRESDKNCLIFFVADHEGYLDDALNKHAFRFWIKPLDRNKLAYGIDSAIKEIESSAYIIEADTGGVVTKILARNIICLYAQNKKVHILTLKGEIISGSTYRDICCQLEGCRDFYETHRSYSVNFNYVKYYTKDKVFCVAGGNTYEVYLSRRRYDGFIKSFMKWMGGVE